MILNILPFYFVFLVCLAPSVARRNACPIPLFSLLSVVLFLRYHIPSLSPHLRRLKSVKCLLSTNHCVKSWGDTCIRYHVSIQRVYKLFNGIGINIK